MSKAIGIKLADGTFYPILEEGKAEKKVLDLTTVNDNQTTVQVDLYRSETGSMDDAQYVDTLQIDNLVAHPNGETNLSMKIALDEKNSLSAEINDKESGAHSNVSVNLVTLPESERGGPANFDLSDKADSASADIGAVQTDTIHSGNEKVPTEETDKPNAAIDEPFSLDDLDLPDDFGNETTDGANDNFELPDFEADTKTSGGTGTGDATSYSSSPLDFSDLYDKETANGMASSDAESEKMTRTHVVICIICAVICILATILILFIIPSPVNLLSHKNNRNQKVETTKSADVAPENLPAHPQQDYASSLLAARENEIVVSPTPTLIPNPPVSIPQKTEDITYRIKWGDTLWDIADAYYKDPWKYTVISRRNNIKNPDYIVSGTEVIIPAP